MASSNLQMPASLEALLNGPSLEPPHGVVANFTDPRDFAQAMLAVEVLFLIFTTLMVFMRLYTKLIINKKGSLDDLLCVIAWALFVALFSVIRFGSNPVAGRHQWDVQLKDMKHFLYALHLASVINGCIVLVIKASILLQYVTIFSIARRDCFFWVCHTFIWVNVVFYGTCFFLEIFSCRPIAKAWDPLITTGSCPVDVKILNVAASSINVLSDLVILLLPQGIIWNLHMSTTKRLGVSLIFATALIACTFASIRLYYCVSFYHSDDTTWYASMMAIYMCAELGLAIIVSCLPALPKFARTVSQMALISHFSASLSTLLGVSREQSTDRYPQVKSKHSLRQIGSGKKPRLNTFQRLVEQHELQSVFAEESKVVSTTSAELSEA